MHANTAGACLHIRGERILVESHHVASSHGAAKCPQCQLLGPAVVLPQQPWVELGSLQDQLRKASGITVHIFRQQLPRLFPASASAAACTPSGTKGAHGPVLQEEDLSKPQRANQQQVQMTRKLWPWALKSHHETEPASPIHATQHALKQSARTLSAPFSLHRQSPCRMSAHLERAGESAGQLLTGRNAAWGSLVHGAPHSFWRVAAGEVQGCQQLDGASSCQVVQQRGPPLQPHVQQLQPQCQLPCMCDGNACMLLHHAAGRPCVCDGTWDASSVSQSGHAGPAAVRLQHR